MRALGRPGAEEGVPFLARVLAAAEDPRAARLGRRALGADRRRARRSALSGAEPRPTTSVAPPPRRPSAGRAGRILKSLQDQCRYCGKVLRRLTVGCGRAPGRDRVRGARRRHRRHPFGDHTRPHRPLRPLPGDAADGCRRPRRLADVRVPVSRSCGSRAGSPGASTARGWPRSPSSRSPPPRHLAGGFDVEEAVGSIALLVALLAPAPVVRRPRRPDEPARRWSPASRSRSPRGRSSAPPPSEHLNRITDLGFEFVLASGAFWALHQWLRAHREPCGQTDADLDRARAFVADHGDDSLSFFALGRDRRYMFSRAGNAFLAYRVVAGCALVAGDPIGGGGRGARAWSTTSRAVCRERGWRFVVLHASDRWLDLYRARGMRAFRKRRRGGARSHPVLARGPRDPEGAPVRRPAGPAPATSFGSLLRNDLSEAERADVDAVTREWLGRRRRPRLLDGDGRSATPHDGPASRSPPTATAASAASSTSCRRRAATRSRRCGAAARRPTASWSS